MKYFGWFVLISSFLLRINTNSRDYFLNGVIIDAVFIICATALIIVDRIKPNKKGKSDA